MGILRRLRGPTTWALQEIMNLMTDPDVTSTPLGIRGGLGWVDEEKSKRGWVKQPYMGKPPRVEAIYHSSPNQRKIKFQGWHADYNAATSANDWIITYLIWNSEGTFARSQTKIGVFDNATGISWDITGDIA